MARCKCQGEYQSWLDDPSHEDAGVANKRCRIISSIIFKVILKFVLVLIASLSIFALVSKSLSAEKPVPIAAPLKASEPSDSFIIYSQIKSSKSLRATSEIKTPACIDHEGNVKDWFIAYKLPKSPDKQFQDEARTGYEYVIMANDYDLEIMNELLCVKRRKLCSTVREVLAYYDPLDLDGEEPDDFWDGLKNKGVSYNGVYFVYKEKLWITHEFFNGEYSKLLHRRKLKYLKKKYRLLLDELIGSGQWIRPNHFINDHQSAIVQTLKIAYSVLAKNSSASPINSLFYNDELPVNSKAENKRAHSDLLGGTFAHAKGVVVMDELSDDAIWLSHSLPKFPSYRKEGLYFHNNSHSFGQTFMCISFKFANSGKQIIDHLLKMNPQIYDHEFSQKMLDRFPNLKHLIGLELTQPNTYHKLLQEIQSINNTKLKLFSKDHKFGADLYSKFIEHELNSSLLVQTWRRGKGDPLASSCPDNNYQTININDLKLNEQKETPEWRYLEDHSKWAINGNFQERPWFCISDINRMHSQFSRGGGAICFECLKCTFVFSKMIDEVEACPINATKTST